MAGATLENAPQTSMGMITEITRGHIRLSLGEKIITVQVEGFARGYGSPDFVIYENSIKAWDPPFDANLIDEATKKTVLREIERELSMKGMTIEIE